MDNASKALIMAGAILIAVAIVGIGIYIFSASNSLTNNAVDQIDTIAVQMFNNNFLQYAEQDEVINGLRTTQLYDAVNSNKGQVSYDGPKKEDIVSTKSYLVHYDFDTTSKYIYNVKVTEQKR